MRLSLLLSLAVSAFAVDPAAVYNGGYASAQSVKLRIGNGGAGQSGLIKVLADAFIQASVRNGSDPFQVAWYKSDTTESINYLQENVVDIGITYTPAAETIAIDAGIAKGPAWYAWRDHFMLVGPAANPASLRKSQDVKTMFSNIFSRAALGDALNSSVPVRFLSRYDKSATNIKESQLWIAIGQVPWATDYSKWYHQYIAYPIQALTAAILLDEYTITDRGTYLSISPELQNQTVIYKAATDDASDPLLNPAHMLVGARAKNGKMADAFTQWVVGSEGQSVITSFTKNGQQLYTAAPANKTAPF
ncbi:hypothetical protein P175DRAFT_0436178 [Aspergillus ochraceoroseus IBT 24754]|uniref:PBP domain-containing protein n=3 Tax=Aspergillus subgen. Nidulantes TaxID=2720870 RepID=A0A0F8U466_9EURO|nr:uncharacterized protein P175DRAFT_0436178 [Aspergillus ochraceoroseus IBT 24754]KKK14383.1 hypothetical protein ARAM_000095 [Aspergillus rambellii]KKK25568.1 hypothetical protein AOCH_000092 [Aspergillus ochraceoroseus]PTU21574.1 hypothetical protein P175DRAFT_0436178 [Aspergillus ochraceoroseus IBT 24754]